MGTETETETTTDRMKAGTRSACDICFRTIPLISYRVLFHKARAYSMRECLLPAPKQHQQWQAAPRDRNCVCSMLHVDLVGRVSQSCREARHALLPVCQFPGVHWNKHHTLGAVRPVGAGPKTWY